MDFAHILVESAGAVCKVTVNRPDRLNAVDLDTATELKTVMEEIRKDTSVRAVLVTGAGDKAFIVGADKDEIAAGKDAGRNLAFENVCRDAFRLIGEMEKPVVCAINGFCFGLGLQLALACTFRIASVEARFGLPEVNMGFFPSMGATQRLARLVGEAKAMEMILTGERIGAEEALKMGLVNRVVPAAEVGVVAGGLAAGLSEKSPIAVGLAMRAIRHGRDMTLSCGLAYEAELSEECGRLSRGEKA